MSDILLIRTLEWNVREETLYFIEQKLAQSHEGSLRLWSRMIQNDLEWSRMISSDQERCWLQSKLGMWYKAIVGDTPHHRQEEGGQLGSVMVWWSYNETMTSSVCSNFDNHHNFHIQLENNTWYCHIEMW